MRLYNTFSRQIEKFTPKNPSEVKIYTCGPTVYSTAHIGNFTSYIYWDLLVRTLKANGFLPKRVLNITDVGHLSSDADDGEDKLEKGAKREGKTVWEVADFYAKKFLEDFQALDLVMPEKIARATDYVEQDKKIVEKLIEQGLTYETVDGIYFDTSKFERYAVFAKLDLENLKAGARVDFSEEKKNPSDFAVWKFVRPNENHAMQWNFLGRAGYPGWHLECSAIIHEELGETIDIHCGGIDHIPVHHTNEIAQSELAFGKKLAEFWLHCDFITIDGEKISKSLGNGCSLDDLRGRGFSPLDFKMWVLEGNYRTARNFTFESLEAAKKRRLNWRNKIALNYQKTGVENLWSADVFSEEKAFAEVLDELNDNLNSAAAFAKIDSFSQPTMEFWQRIDELFGLGLIKETADISSGQKKMLEERKTAREMKDFQKSDEIRAKLFEMGIEELDTVNGQIWQYAE